MTASTSADTTRPGELESGNPPYPAHDGFGDLADAAPDDRFEDDEPADDDVSSPVTIHELRSAPNAARVRLDQFITRSVQNASRTKVQELIEAGGVTVGGAVVRKPGRLVLPGEYVVCTVPKPPPPDIIAEDIPLDIVYEDDEVLVVNKPAGMVSHPAFGNYSGTLVNALMWHTTRLAQERGPERAGILHRLDKDTSGLLCVAKSDAALAFLGAQFAAHTVDREYQALVWGGFPHKTGRIEEPVGRHRSDRKKMAVVEGGKHAITDYEVLRDYGPISLVRLRLHTGRTHQIRVHLSHERHPVFGDPTYGGRRIMYGAVTGPYKQFIEQLLTVLPRQALHARTLGFVHPVTRERIHFASELPADMRTAIDLLEAYFA